MSKKQNSGSFNSFTSRGIRFPLIYDELGHLMGEVLTIIDASISDKAQNKAIKDLIRNKFGHVIHDVFRDMCYLPDFYFADEYYKNNVIESKSSGEVPVRPPRGYPMPEVTDSSSNK